MCFSLAARAYCISSRARFSRVRARHVAMPCAGRNYRHIQYSSEDGLPPDKPTQPPRHHHYYLLGTCARHAAPGRAARQPAPRLTTVAAAIGIFDRLFTSRPLTLYYARLLEAAGVISLIALLTTSSSLRAGQAYRLPLARRLRA